MSDSHYDRQMRAISNGLTELQLSHDTKYLATAMMHRSAYMLRMLLTAGVWTEDDVRAVIDGALEDVYQPLPEQPRKMELDARLDREI